MTMRQKFIGWIAGGGAITIVGVLWYGAQAFHSTMKEHDAQVAAQAAKEVMEQMDHRRIGRLEVMAMNSDKESSFNYQVILAVAHKLGLKEGDQIPTRPLLQQIPAVEGSPLPLSSISSSRSQDAGGR